MKGTFKITLEYLKELGACRDGQREFQKAFPNGGEYQEVLDRCAQEGDLILARDEERWTSLAAFLLVLLFAAFSDGLMDALGPVSFFAVGLAVMGAAWAMMEADRE